jgi:peptide/nickel transport system substrate-binding protein
VEKKLGPVVFIGNTVNESYLGAFEGFYTYVYITTHPEDDGRTYYTHYGRQLMVGPKKMDIDDAFSRAYSGMEVPLELKTFFITVVPGYDDTNVRSPGLVRDREEGELYRRLWRTAIGLDADSVIITSWNEWHEGTELEPSKEYGFYYLNLTRVYVERYQGVPVPIPEISFSATIPSISQDPGLAGSGEILLTAREVPAIYVNVTVVGDESVSSLDLQGDFYTYLREVEGNRASILIPSVPPRSELVVRIVYEAESIGPAFNILVTAYDPFGVLYELYRGQLRALRESSISASVSPDSIRIGESVTITGSVIPRRGGRTVRISYTRPDSSTLVRTVTTAADGSFRDTYEPDAIGQWSVEVSWEGDAEHMGSTSPTLYFMVEEKGCIIATSTYGSELSPEVQFLREFRDEAILKTFAGKNFMTAFNVWYYSFSPRVAEMIEGNPLLRTAMKIVFYPLIGILHLATAAYSLLSFNSELAVVVSGLFASFLIGLTYFGPVVFILRLVKKLRVPTKALLASLLIWALSLCLIVIAEIIRWSGLMMLSTAIFVLSAISISSLTFGKLLMGSEEGSSATRHP